MKPRTLTILGADVAALLAYLLFGMLVSFDSASAHWYLPLVASLAAGSMVHLYRRGRVRSTK